MKLSGNPNLEVVDLNLSYFSDRIRENDYFSYLKHCHAVWDAISQCDKGKGLVVDENYRTIVANNISMHRHNANFKIPPIYFKYLLDTLVKRPSTKDFLYGVSDVAWRMNIHRDYKHKSFANQHATIKKWVLCEKIFEGDVWRREAYEGDLAKFLKGINDRRIVIVGPFYFYDFAKRLGLKDYHFVQVDYYSASKKIVNTYEQIKAKHIPGTIYFFMLGGLTAWLLGNLHDNLKDKFLIDVGRAFDTFYLELRNDMKWTWLQKTPLEKLTQMSTWYNSEGLNLFKLKTYKNNETNKTLIARIHKLQNRSKRPSP